MNGQAWQLIALFHQSVTAGLQAEYLPLNHMSRCSVFPPDVQLMQPVIIRQSLRICF